jgi:hypothetical protein
MSLAGWTHLKKLNSQHLIFYPFLILEPQILLKKAKFIVTLIVYVKPSVFKY